METASRPRSQGCAAIATSAPIARNGANGIVRLRAAQPCRASRTRPAIEPAANATTSASTTRGAQVDAKHPRELDVSEAHAVGPDQRGGEQEPGGGGAGQQPPGHSAGVGEQADRHRDGQARHQGAVRNQAGAQVADRDDAEQGDERRVEQRGGHIVESPVALDLSP